MAVFVFLKLACSTTFVSAQRDKDIITIAKARAAYLTGPVPGAISCRVSLDWDGFFQRMNTEQTDVMKARLEKLKATKIAIVSSDADHTDVKFDPEDATAGGLRQQLQGFFQIFWSMSYGRLLAVKPGDHFELTTVPEGYVVKSTAGATKVVINMDEKY